MMELAMEPDNPWKTLRSQEVYANPWFRVRQDAVLRPDGNPGIYGVVEIRPSVGIVAVDDQNRVALVGQWRYVNSQYVWEIPRGGSEPGETDMRRAAERELREEAGLEAANWRYLTAAPVCNGVTTDVQHLYWATGLRAVPRCNDPEERIDVRWLPFDQAIQQVLDGTIAEVCSVAALLFVDRLLRNAGSGNLVGS